jgi:hypothetical protein
MFSCTTKLQSNYSTKSLLNNILETCCYNHLRHILRFGAAFMGPPPPPPTPPVFVVPEIPPYIRAPNRIQHQTISSTSSADESVILVEETIDVLEIIDVFSSDDEAEDTDADENQEGHGDRENQDEIHGEIHDEIRDEIEIIPNEPELSSGDLAQAVQTTDATATPRRFSMRNYPPAIYDPHVMPSLTNQTYVKAWRSQNPETPDNPENNDEVRLYDSDNYPEATPDLIRVGPDYPNDERPAYTRS